MKVGWNVEKENLCLNMDADTLDEAAQLLETYNYLNARGILKLDLKSVPTGPPPTSIPTYPAQRDRNLVVRMTIYGDGVGSLQGDK